MISQVATTLAAIFATAVANVRWGRIANCLKNAQASLHVVDREIAIPYMPNLDVKAHLKSLYRVPGSIAHDRCHGVECTRMLEDSALTASPCA